MIQAELTTIGPDDLPTSSPHFNERPKSEITAIVVHDVVSHSAIGTVRHLQRPETKASYQVVIDRDGERYRIVSDDKRAWHAGVSELWGERDCNGFSLGVGLIDLDPETRKQAYTPEQIESLVDLCGGWSVQHGIWLNRVVGHLHVATPYGRKVDPGSSFPWRSFLASVARWTH